MPARRPYFTRLCFPALLLAALLTCAQGTRAQTGTEASSSRDVFLAFFKAGGTMPDFEKMIRERDDFRLVPRTRERTHIAEEKRKLLAEWQALDQNEDLLLVRVPVFVELARRTGVQEQAVHTLTFTFEQADNLYFPYEYMDYKIALMPQKAEDLMYQQISETEYGVIRSGLGENGAERGMAHLWFRLKPVKSYLNQPYEIDNADQWVFLANIAGLSLTGEDGRNLWNYTAPWYVSPVTDDLLTIYDERQLEKAREQAENPLAPPASGASSQ